MRHGAKDRQLSRTSKHRRAMLNNMATSLLQHDRVETTVAKAKELRPVVEKQITLARRGDLTHMSLVGGSAEIRVIFGLPIHGFGDLLPSPTRADRPFHTIRPRVQPLSR